MKIWRKCLSDLFDLDKEWMMLIYFEVYFNGHISENDQIAGRNWV